MKDILIIIRRKGGHTSKLRGQPLQTVAATWDALYATGCRPSHRMRQQVEFAAMECSARGLTSTAKLDTHTDLCISLDVTKD